MQNAKNTTRSSGLFCSRGGLLTAAAGLAISAVAAYAQPAPPRWVSLDPAAGPGTPPSCTVNKNSTEDRTILDIAIPGFYVEDVVVPGFGTFQKLSIPPMTSSVQLVPAIQKIPGSAGVPVLNMLVALPSDAETSWTGTLTVTNSTVVGNMRILPAQPDIMEEETADPENQPPFEYNASAYNSTIPYPPGNGEAIGPVGKKSGIRLQPMSIKPFKYIPAINQMTANSKFSVVIEHPGDPLPQTREHILLAKQIGMSTCNFDTPAAPWIAEHVDYEGAFLFITKADVENDIRPLVQQKQRKGYTTRVATEEDVDTNGNGSMSATEVRNYIKGWYDDHTNETLKFVILVGDVNRIPNAVDPMYGYPSDYYYACYEDDMFADMGLGRITFNAGQLPDIVSRILKYEDLPPAAEEYYSKSLAIAHNQENANFATVLDDAISIPFPADEPMSFTKAYGTNPGASGTNTFVIDKLDEGQHIVYYRGHGSPNTFYEWSNLEQHFLDSYLIDNNNPEHPTWCPIVISSACANAALGNSDCLMEDWFQRPVNGAVASYGALIGSRRDMNHGFTTMWWGYLRTYGQNGNISAHMEWAQILGFLQQWSPGMSDPLKNLWTYSLLGDPEMKIWGKKPDHAAPEFLPPDIVAGATSLDITVRNGQGDAIPGAVIAAFKEGEVQEAVYADANGKATLKVNPQSYGVLTIRTYTYDDATGGSESQIQVGACPADADGSGFVDTDDFDFFVKMFEAGAQQADFDQSGFVDTDDFDAFVRAFERGC